MISYDNISGIEFVNRVDELLKQKGKKRADLNRALNYNRNKLTQCKQNDSIPSAQQVLNIATYLETSMEYLLTGESTETDLEKTLIDESFFEPKTKKDYYSGVELVNRIDGLLKTKDKTRVDLCKDLNYDMSKIGQWKLKNIVPSARFVYEIATYLDTSVEYLLTGEEPNVNIMTVPTIPKEQAKQTVKKALKDILDEFDRIEE